MWQADRKAYTLFIAIGAQRVDFGLLSRRGDASRWSKKTCRGFDLPNDANEAALLRGLTHLERYLFAHYVHYGVRDVRVLIADIWLAQVSLPWSAAMKRNESAQENACDMIATAGFKGSWARPVRISDAPYGVPRLAVAYPQAVLATMEKLAARLGARLDSLQPFSVAAWEAALPKNRYAFQALMLIDRGWIALLAVPGLQGAQAGEIVARRSSVHETFPFRTVQANWQRACLRQPQWAAFERIGVLSFAETKSDDVKPGLPFEVFKLRHEDDVDIAPALLLAEKVKPACHALDAVFRHAPPSTAQRVALALCTLLIAAMSALLFSNARSIDAFNAHLGDMRPLVKQAIPESAWSREESSRIRAVNTAIRELNLPIGAILRALQPPQELHVAVLGVDAASGASARTIRVTAEAPTGEDMAQYVKFISERHPLFSAYLIRHEIIETASGHPYRFTVDAQWVD